MTRVGWDADTPNASVQARYCKVIGVLSERLDLISGFWFPSTSYCWFFS